MELSQETGLSASVIRYISHCLSVIGGWSGVTPNSLLPARRSLIHQNRDRLTLLNPICSRENHRVAEWM
ncbi:hypothetical protein, partial [Phormidium sp. CCY1219]|uniref:hypothetical protein n=1 Tax=Phormidium sp. CCY1219 TaxID=2886104 RepID=UPI002D1F834F